MLRLCSRIFFLFRGSLCRNCFVLRGIISAGWKIDNHLSHETKQMIRSLYIYFIYFLAERGQTSGMDVRFVHHQCYKQEDSFKDQHSKSWLFPPELEMLTKNTLSTRPQSRLSCWSVRLKEINSANIGQQMTTKQFATFFSLLMLAENFVHLFLGLFIYVWQTVIRQTKVFLPFLLNY